MSNRSTRNIVAKLSRGYEKYLHSKEAGKNFIFTTFLKQIVSGKKVWKRTSVARSPGFCQDWMGQWRGLELGSSLTKVDSS
jgi:hypothetical protein